MLVFQGNPINFVSAKSFIKTVERNLLGADIREAVRWIKKYFYPDGYDRFRARYKRNSVNLVMIEGNEIIELAPEGMTNHLLSMAVDYPILFNEDCYDRFGFIKEELDLFFESKNINLDFQSINSYNLKLDDDKKDELITKLRHEIEAINKNKVENNFGSILYLNEFRDDDPLALAIEIRNKEWAGYVHDDKSTRGNQESIILELTNKGLSKKQAESVELVACPIKR
ncbi:hypothetical protein [Xenorhabdus stockiae]|uniref:hypothetical protein n=1 Tax=Xenorhabdus stockiae TaxID=351614 RepID=UPI004063A867